MGTTFSTELDWVYDPCENRWRLGLPPSIIPPLSSSRTSQQQQLFGKLSSSPSLENNNSESENDQDGNTNNNNNVASSSSFSGDPTLSHFVLQHSPKNERAISMLYFSLLQAFCNASGAGFNDDRTASATVMKRRFDRPLVFISEPAVIPMGDVESGLGAVEPKAAASTFLIARNFAPAFAELEGEDELDPTNPAFIHHQSNSGRMSRSRMSLEQTRERQASRRAALMNVQNAATTVNISKDTTKFSPFHHYLEVSDSLGKCCFARLVEGGAIVFDLLPEAQLEVLSKGDDRRATKYSGVGVAENSYNNNNNDHGKIVAPNASSRSSSVVSSIDDGAAAKSGFFRTSNNSSLNERDRDSSVVGTPSLNVSQQENNMPVSQKNIITVDDDILNDLVDPISKVARATNNVEETKSRQRDSSTPPSKSFRKDENVNDDEEEEAKRRNASSTPQQQQPTIASDCVAQPYDNYGLSIIKEALVNHIQAERQKKNNEREAAEKALIDARHRLEKEARKTARARKRREKQEVERQRRIANGEEEPAEGEQQFQVSKRATDLDAPNENNGNNEEFEKSSDDDGEEQNEKEENKSSTGDGKTVKTNEAKSQEIVNDDDDGGENISIFLHESQDEKDQPHLASSINNNSNNNNPANKNKNNSTNDNKNAIDNNNNNDSFADQQQFYSFSNAGKRISKNVQVTCHSLHHFMVYLSLVASSAAAEEVEYTLNYTTVPGTSNNNNANANNNISSNSMNNNQNRDANAGMSATTSNQVRQFQQQLRQQQQHQQKSLNSSTSQNKTTNNNNLNATSSPGTINTASPSSAFMMSMMNFNQQFQKTTGEVIQQTLWDFASQSPGFVHSIEPQYGGNGGGGNTSSRNTSPLLMNNNSSMRTNSPNNSNRTATKSVGIRSTSPLNNNNNNNNGSKAISFSRQPVFALRSLVTRCGQTLFPPRGTAEARKLIASEEADLFFTAVGSQMTVEICSRVLAYQNCFQPFMTVSFERAIEGDINISRLIAPQIPSSSIHQSHNNSNNNKHFNNTQFSFLSRIKGLVPRMSLSSTEAALHAIQNGRLVSAVAEAEIPGALLMAAGASLEVCHSSPRTLLAVTREVKNVLEHIAKNCPADGHPGEFITRYLIDCCFMNSNPMIDELLGTFNSQKERSILGSKHQAGSVFKLLFGLTETVPLPESAFNLRQQQQLAEEERLRKIQDDELLKLSGFGNLSGNLDSFSSATGNPATAMTLEQTILQAIQQSPCTSSSKNNSKNQHQPTPSSNALVHWKNDEMESHAPSEYVNAALKTVVDATTVTSNEILSRIREVSSALQSTRRKGKHQSSSDNNNNNGKYSKEENQNLILRSHHGGGLAGHGDFFDELGNDVTDDLVNDESSGNQNLIKDDPQELAALMSSGPKSNNNNINSNNSQSELARRRRQLLARVPSGVMVVDEDQEYKFGQWEQAISYIQNQAKMIMRMSPNPILSFGANPLLMNQQSQQSTSSPKSAKSGKKSMGASLLSAEETQLLQKQQEKMILLSFAKTLLMFVAALREIDVELFGQLHAMSLRNRSLHSAPHTVTAPTISLKQEKLFAEVELLKIFASHSSACLNSVANSATLRPSSPEINNNNGSSMNNASSRRRRSGGSTAQPSNANLSTSSSASTIAALNQNILFSFQSANLPAPSQEALRISNVEIHLPTVIAAFGTSRVRPLAELHITIRDSQYVVDRQQQLIQQNQQQKSSSNLPTSYPHQVIKVCVYANGVLQFPENTNSSSSASNVNQTNSGVQAVGSLANALASVEAASRHRSLLSTPHESTLLRTALSSSNSSKILSKNNKNSADISGTTSSSSAMSTMMLNKMPNRITADNLLLMGATHYSSIHELMVNLLPDAYATWDELFNGHRLNTMLKQLALKSGNAPGSLLMGNSSTNNGSSMMLALTLADGLAAAANSSPARNNNNNNNLGSPIPFVARPSSAMSISTLNNSVLNNNTNNNNLRPSSTSITSNSSSTARRILPTSSTSRVMNANVSNNNNSLSSASVITNQYSTMMMVNSGEPSSTNFIPSAIVLADSLPRKQLPSSSLKRQNNNNTSTPMKNRIAHNKSFSNQVFGGFSEGITRSGAIGEDSDPDEENDIDDENYDQNDEDNVEDENGNIMNKNNNDEYTSLANAAKANLTNRRQNSSNTVSSKNALLTPKPPSSNKNPSTAATPHQKKNVKYSNKDPSTQDAADLAALGMMTSKESSAASFYCAKPIFVPDYPASQLHASSMMTILLAPRLHGEPMLRSLSPPLFCDATSSLRAHADFLVSNVGRDNLGPISESSFAWSLGTRWFVANPLDIQNAHANNGNHNNNQNNWKFSETQRNNQNQQQQKSSNLSTAAIFFMLQNSLLHRPILRGLSLLQETASTIVYTPTNNAMMNILNSNSNINSNNNFIFNSTSSLGSGGGASNSGGSAAMMSSSQRRGSSPFQHASAQNNNNNNNNNPSGILFNPNNALLANSPLTHQLLQDSSVWEKIFKFLDPPKYGSDTPTFSKILYGIALTRDVTIALDGFLQTIQIDNRLIEAQYEILEHYNTTFSLLEKNFTRAFQNIIRIACSGQSPHRVFARAISCLSYFIAVCSAHFCRLSLWPNPNLPNHVSAIGSAATGLHKLLWIGLSFVDVRGLLMASMSRCSSVLNTLIDYSATADEDAFIIAMTDASNDEAAQELLAQQHRQSYEGFKETSDNNVATKTPKKNNNNNNGNSSVRLQSPAMSNNRSPTVSFVDHNASNNNNNNSQVEFSPSNYRPSPIDLLTAGDPSARDPEYMQSLKLSGAHETAALVVTCGVELIAVTSSTSSEIARRWVQGSNNAPNSTSNTSRTPAGNSSTASLSTTASPAVFFLDQLLSCTLPELRFAFHLATLAWRSLCLLATPAVSTAQHISPVVPASPYAAFTGNTTSDWYLPPQVVKSVAANSVAALTMLGGNVLPSPTIASLLSLVATIHRVTPAAGRLFSNLRLDRAVGALWEQLNFRQQQKSLIGASRNARDDDIDVGGVGARTSSSPAFPGSPSQSQQHQHQQPSSTSTEESLRAFGFSLFSAGNSKSKRKDILQAADLAGEIAESELFLALCWVTSVAEDSLILPSQISPWVRGMFENFAGQCFVPVLEKVSLPWSHTNPFSRIVASPKMSGSFSLFHLALLKSYNRWFEESSASFVGGLMRFGAPFNLPTWFSLAEKIIPPILAHRVKNAQQLLSFLQNGLHHSSNNQVVLTSKSTIVSFESYIQFVREMIMNLADARDCASEVLLVDCIDLDSVLSESKTEKNPASPQRCNHTSSHKMIASPSDVKDPLPKIEATSNFIFAQFHNALVTPTNTTGSSAVTLNAFYGNNLSANSRSSAGGQQQQQQQNVLLSSNFSEILGLGSNFAALIPSLDILLLPHAIKQILQNAIDLPQRRRSFAPNAVTSPTTTTKKSQAVQNDQNNNKKNIRSGSVPEILAGRSNSISKKNVPNLPHNSNNEEKERSLSPLPMLLGVTPEPPGLTSAGDDEANNKSNNKTAEDPSNKSTSSDETLKSGSTHNGLLVPLREDTGVFEESHNNNNNNEDNNSKSHKPLPSAYSTTLKPRGISNVTDQTNDHDLNDDSNSTKHTFESDALFTSGALKDYETTSNHQQVPPSPPKPVSSHHYSSDQRAPLGKWGVERLKTLSENAAALFPDLLFVVPEKSKMSLSFAGCLEGITSVKTLARVMQTAMLHFPTQIKEKICSFVVFSPAASKNINNNHSNNTDRFNDSIDSGNVQTKLNSYRFAPTTMNDSQKSSSANNDVEWPLPEWTRALPVLMSMLEATINPATLGPIRNTRKSAHLIFELEVALLSMCAHAAMFVQNFGQIVPALSFFLVRYAGPRNLLISDAECVGGGINGSRNNNNNNKSTPEKTQSTDSELIEVTRQHRALRVGLMCVIDAILQRSAVLIAEASYLQFNEDAAANEVNLTQGLREVITHGIVTLAQHTLTPSETRPRAFTYSKFPVSMALSFGFAGPMTTSAILAGTDAVSSSGLSGNEGGSSTTTTTVASAASHYYQNEVKPLRSGSNPPTASSYPQSRTSSEIQNSNNNNPSNSFVAASASANSTNHQALLACVPHDEQLCGKNYDIDRSTAIMFLQRLLLISKKVGVASALLQEFARRGISAALLSILDSLHSSSFSENLNQSSSSSATATSSPTLRQKELERTAEYTGNKNINSSFGSSRGGNSEKPSSNVQNNSNNNNKSALEMVADALLTTIHKYSDEALHQATSRK